MDEQPKKRGYGGFLAFFTIILLIGAGIFAYTKFSSSQSIPRDFFIKYAQSDAMVKKIFATLPFQFDQLGNDVQSQNYSGANHLVTQGLINSIKNTNRLRTVQTKTAELKPLATKISDSSVRTDVTKLFELIDQRNSILGRILSNQTKLFTALKDYYEAILLGKQGQLSGEVNQLVQSMQKDIQDVSQVQFEIDTAYDELLKKAEIDKASLEFVTKATTGFDDVGGDIIITEAPTPIPTWEAEVGVDSSPSASPIPTNSSATSSAQ